MYPKRSVFIHPEKVGSRVVFCLKPVFKMTNKKFYVYFAKIWVVFMNLESRSWTQNLFYEWSAFDIIEIYKVI